jgi:hypothetical protein
MTADVITYTASTTEVAVFLTARFGDRSGWLCLGWIDGDPALEPLRETWFKLPRQLSAAIQCAQTLADCHYNLYVAPCLFGERRRSYATALPSAWLWLDDVAVDGAELVESSEGNYQSWLPLDQPLDARERSALQRALRDATQGADTCSADAVHMTRLPGGWNCKHDARWQVRIARPAGAPLCVDELRERFPCTQPSAQENVSAGDWSALPSGDTLAVSLRFRALLHANEQLGQVVANAPVGIDCHGYHDASRSAHRAIFVCQLLRARYPHDEIRALAVHFADVLDSGRGEARFRCDVDRLLAKYTPAGYAPEATRAATIGDEYTPLQGGRPIALTSEALLLFYHQHADCGPRGIVLDWTRAEVARELRVSLKTIERREGALIAAGTIRREVSVERQRSCVILSPATWNAGTHCTEMPSTQAPSLGTGDVATERAAMASTHDLPLAAGVAGPCRVAASETALPATPAPTLAAVPGTGAEKTHHRAAEADAVTDESAPDNPASDGQASQLRTGRTVWGGVSFLRRSESMIIRPIGVFPILGSRDVAAHQCHRTACRAPPGLCACPLARMRPPAVLDRNAQSPSLLRSPAAVAAERKGGAAPRWPPQTASAASPRGTKIMTRSNHPIRRERPLDTDRPASERRVAARTTPEAAAPTPLHGGRPFALTTAALRTYYQQHAVAGPGGLVVAWTRSDVARHLRVSADTVGRREAELIAAGAIRRELSPDRQRSWLVLLSADSDVDADTIEQAAPQG